MVGLIRELALYRAEVLRGAGFSVVVAEDFDDALQTIQRNAFDAIILSYTLPNETVQRLADAARQYCPDCPIVSITDNPVYDNHILPDAVAIASEGPSSLLAALRRVLKPS